MPRCTGSGGRLFLLLVKRLIDSFRQVESTGSYEYINGREDLTE